MEFVDDVVEVVAEPAVAGAPTGFLQRVEVGAARGEAGQNDLEQPRRLGLGATALRPDQEVEVEAWHREACRPATCGDHRRAEDQTGQHEQRRSCQAEQGETPCVDVQPRGPQTDALTLHGAVEE